MNAINRFDHTNDYHLAARTRAIYSSSTYYGRYANTSKVIDAALALLEQSNHYDRWVEDLRNKIDLAAAQLDCGEGIDGEIAIAQLRSKLYKTHNFNATVHDIS